MGLDVTVGQLSLIGAEVDDEGVALAREDFAELSAALVRAGAGPHHEPETLDAGLTYEDRVGGYGSLHHLRRMAAWLAVKRVLPPPLTYQDNTAEDAVLQSFYILHNRDLASRRQQGWLGRLLKGKSPPPAFQHLLWHSDCDGWYVPQDFERVMIDPADPADGRRGMIGSAPRLLAECQVLARAIGLPPGVDPDDYDADGPTGPASDLDDWRRYQIEAYVLSRLIRACEVSIQTGAAVVFC